MGRGMGERGGGGEWKGEDGIERRDGRMEMELGRRFLSAFEHASDDDEDAFTTQHLHTQTSLLGFEMEG